MLHGRNYDCEISYGETVTVTPRNYPFSFSNLDAQDSHYAIMGITANIPDYPLYYDAVNEKGLAMAGLNFPAMHTTQNLPTTRLISPHSN
ncbi:linear amide C-N hydrolase [Methanobrevibacter sp.]